MNVSSSDQHLPSEDEFACSIAQQQPRDERASLIGEVRALGRFAFGLYCRFTSLMFGRA
jgi:hypothetical protein